MSKRNPKTIFIKNEEKGGGQNQEKNSGKVIRATHLSKGRFLVKNEPYNASKKTNIRKLKKPKIIKDKIVRKRKKTVERVRGRGYQIPCGYLSLEGHQESLNFWWNEGTWKKEKEVNQIIKEKEWAGKDRTFEKAKPVESIANWK